MHSLGHKASEFLGYEVAYNKFFYDFIFFIFRERGREGEKEGEKHQWVTSCMLPTGDLAHTQACTLTRNQTCDL